MPGFRIGIDANEAAGTAPPAAPIYSYTWEFTRLSTRTRDNSLLYCKDATLPDFSVDVEEYKTSIAYKFAKGVNFGDVKITFYATSGLIATLEEVKKRIWSPTAGILPAANYKDTSVITQYYADDGDTTAPAAVWTLNNSWIKGISHSTLTYGTSDVHNVIVTVAYDWATVQTNNP
jgi:hypothetical protein